MKQYKIHPEVPGGIGENTIYDKTAIPWKVVKLHVVIDGWMGGDLLKVSSCILVTNNLRDALVKKSILKDLDFEELEIETSLTFKTVHANMVLPKLYWAKLPRMETNLPMFLNDKNKLIVDENVFALLSTFNLSDSEIDEV